MEAVQQQQQQQQQHHHHHVLNTQTSTESGWDNPFRPEGDLSREADEIVNLIRDGKPITPTGDYNHTIINGTVEKKEITQISSSAKPGSKDIQIKEQHITTQQQQSAQNGKKSTTTTTTITTSTKTTNNDKTNNDKTSATTTKVSNTTVPGPASASYVVIEEKKNKKCNCCTIQ
ncbi:probable serine/threonine-protein kinase MARK-A [Condylostylus longicornis]|uniref:probable serine/threonine-protein kinase MARK-A n=1 Tax=Condylostylus longicornis TaxID=2530218 RepID=UPI00244DAF7B|nr:probable serine/threonine-protein kinase MARK-A [Condylostylus longicornis]XP_055385308.1 probable serine/threonine-protein kinase MARK-A [Condylostylus longicornis]XP_055385309.1 probable serine/threonine-protein kinase MARK-A [Condylostylus longicornis]XP_055385310.1 probable serine/threonine-protein kinase MARK-A [Condylostylus longicornis]